VGKRSEWLVDKSEAVSADGMVTAMQPLAAEAGAEMLRQGGSAIDAAVATAFATGVVEPYMSGVGGIAFLVFRDASTGRTYCLDGSTVLPRASRPELFEILPGNERSGSYGWPMTKDDANRTGYLSPGVPGMPAMVEEAHRRWGRLPWAEVLEPAIRLADEGFDVNHDVALNTAAQYSRLGRFAESKRTFFKPDGSPYSAKSSHADSGDRLRQLDLARSLQLIAAEGTDCIYRGEIGRMIVEDMERNGGLITHDDLEAHRTREFAPHQFDYRGVQVLGQLPNTGYPTVVEALQILEGFDIGSEGFHSPEGVHLIIESFRLAMIDRLRHLGDAEAMPVPMDGIVSRAYAERRREQIDAERAAPDAEPGDPWSFDPAGAGVILAPRAVVDDEHTTHFTAVDREHNTVSLTSTLGQSFGCGVVITGTGITMNSATQWFNPEPGAVNSIGPAKRVMSAATPLLALRGGKPFLALGAPGSKRVISSMYQVIVNVVDYGLSLQEAISAPRMHSEGRVTEISTRFPDEVIDHLERIGHEVVRREETLSATYFARPNGVMIDPDTGHLRSGVFQYTPATAIGV
jgi:gamma-glutamyltranspeptidase / glutathione hydrolase